MTQKKDKTLEEYINLWDNYKNFRNYHLELIKNYLGKKLAEVGPGNGANLHYYYKYPKKLTYMNQVKIYI